MSDDEMWEVFAPTIKWWVLVSIIALLVVLFQKPGSTYSESMKAQVLVRKAVEKPENHSKKAIAMMKQEAVHNLEMAEHLLK